MEHLTVRYAQESDTPQILHFIRELATYENMLDKVVATEELLREWIFEKQKAKVILALEDGEPVGFALFFHNFSTFLGRAGIYLENLSVKPETGVRAMGKPFCGSWHRLPWNAAAAGWNGPAWTGTSPVSTSTSPLTPRPWTSGPSTGSPGIRCGNWPTVKRGFGTRSQPWLRENDVLCWWTEEAPLIFKRLYTPLLQAPPLMGRPIKKDGNSRSTKGRSKDKSESNCPPRYNQEKGSSIHCILSIINTERYICQTI